MSDMEGGAPVPPSVAPDPDSPADVAQPESSRKSRKPWLIVAALVVLVGVLVIAFGGGDDGETIKGTFLLADTSGSITGDPENCEGDGGYSDISGGQSVKVTDGSGDTIGAGTLENIDSADKRERILEWWHENGFADEDDTDKELRDLLDTKGITCFMIFEVDVPKTDFYEIQIGGGDRGNLSYSREELEERDWFVDITIGDV